MIKGTVSFSVRKSLKIHSLTAICHYLTSRLPECPFAVRKGRVMERKGRKDVGGRVTKTREMMLGINSPVGISFL